MVQIERTIQDLRRRVNDSRASYRKIAKLGGVNEGTVRNLVRGDRPLTSESLAGIERGLLALESAEIADLDDVTAEAAA